MKKRIGQNQRHMPNIVKVSYNELLPKHADEVNDTIYLLLLFELYFIFLSRHIPSGHYFCSFFFYFLHDEWINNLRYCMDWQEFFMLQLFPFQLIKKTWSMSIRLLVTKKNENKSRKKKQNISLKR